MIESSSRSGAQQIVALGQEFGASHMTASMQYRGGHFSLVTDIEIDPLIALPLGLTQRLEAKKRDWSKLSLLIFLKVCR